MDAILNKVTQHALNYAIRSGIAVTGGYAIKQCSRLLQSTPRGSGKDELRDLQLRLESKIRIISPAIDMIDLIAARGNTSLESAVQLPKDIRYDIQSLGKRMASAVTDEELFQRRSARAKSREQIELGVQLIMADMRRLLTRIEDAVPLINLAITTSGVSLTTNLSATVSPSRLLQASTLLVAADAQYGGPSPARVQVGPSYTLSMYMLFTGSARPSKDGEEARTTTWKEVMHKAQLKVVRLPASQLYELPGAVSQGSFASSDTDSSIPADDAANEFSYQIVITEDLDDDRVHTFDDDSFRPGSFDDVETAGIRDIIPVHQISKIFYADTGKILDIGSEGETNNPVLLLKRDIHAQPPRRMEERRGSDDDGHTDSVGMNGIPTTDDSRSRSSGNDRWRLPGDLDPEWFAFEVYMEPPDTDDEESELPSEPPSRQGSSRHGSLGPEVTGALSKTSISEPSRAGMVPQKPHSRAHTHPHIKTSLSLLEMLIRLTALQQFRQASHLTIEDELLNFFLRDSSTTGAGPNAEYRQRVRHDARRRLGFDPYDESPMKVRGEDYIAHAREGSPYPGSYYGGDDDNDTFYEDHRAGHEAFVRSSIETPSPLLRHAPRAMPSSTRSSPVPATPAHPRKEVLASAASGTGLQKGRSMVLRSQSEKPRSPLALDSTLGTSPDHLER